MAGKRRAFKFACLNPWGKGRLLAESTRLACLLSKKARKPLSSRERRRFFFVVKSQLRKEPHVASPALRRDVRTPHCRAHSARSTTPLTRQSTPRAQFDEACRGSPHPRPRGELAGDHLSICRKGKPHLSSLLRCSKDLGTKPKSPPTPPLFQNGKANAGAQRLSNKPARRRLAGLRLQSLVANAHQQTPRVFRPGIGAPSSFLCFGAPRGSP